jgi:hypothetical protein
MSIPDMPDMREITKLVRSKAVTILVRRQRKREDRAGFQGEIFLWIFSLGDHLRLPTRNPINHV